jgi:tRNA (cmo5U34)-methyltransferase
LKVFAEAHAGWRFDGVDPSAEMLKLAKTTLGAHAARVTLHEGYIDAAPDGPFDGAACLLTFHFVRLDERRRTLAEARRRLKPAAPFVVAHLSFPQAEPERGQWLSRYFAFAGIEATDTTRAAILSQLTILDPEHDEAILRDAGFSNVTQFYQGFTFRGWVAYA